MKYSNKQKQTLIKIFKLVLPVLTMTYSEETQNKKQCVCSCITYLYGEKSITNAEYELANNHIKYLMGNVNSNNNTIFSWLYIYYGITASEETYIVRQTYRKEWVQHIIKELNQ